MSKLKCNNCGSVFDEFEAEWVEWDEPREFWGMSCSEHMVELHCPQCNSDSCEDYYGNEDEEEEE